MGTRTAAPTPFPAGSLIVRSQDQVSAEVDGQVIVLAMEQGAYFGLDDIASEIWRRIADPRPVADLCSDLCAEYDGTVSQVEDDTRALLSEMLDQGLIEIR